MTRGREHDDGSEAPGGRWQRRAHRHAAERRRMPKHGKTYVTLVESMLARRAKASAATAARGDKAPKAP
jgi:hypothetical protein